MGDRHQNLAESVTILHPKFKKRGGDISKMTE